MADFPSLDVTCRVPGTLLGEGDIAVELAVSSTPSLLHLASPSVTSEIDTSGRQPADEYGNGPTPYKTSALLGFARGLEACRNKLQDPDVKATLRDLSTAVYGLADKRAADVQQGKEKRAEQKKAEAEKAKEAAETKPQTPAKAQGPAKTK